MNKSLKTLFLIIVLLYSCSKKTDSRQSLVGTWNWTVQFYDNPIHFTTPQSTGVQEKLIFDASGGYSVLQNGTIINSGTYTNIDISNKFSDACGNIVSVLFYSNTRTKDSTIFYLIQSNNDSLIISTYGNCYSNVHSKHYYRQ